MRISPNMKNHTFEGLFFRELTYRITGKDFMAGEKY